MTKYILVKEDGFEWAVLVSAIADHRAKYYAEKDTDTTYQAEFDLLMNEAGGDEAMEWMANNMNWEDISPTPRLIMRPEMPDEPDDLCNADYEFKEIDGEFAPID